MAATQRKPSAASSLPVPVSAASTVRLLLIGFLFAFLAQPARVSAAVNPTGRQTPPVLKKRGAPPPYLPPPPAPRTPPPAPGGGKPASAIFPLLGNVYPKGIYYAAVSVGNPPKPYFLDIDTGSDLTWLQCDAPCVKCSKGPHPLYKPPAAPLPCQNPICTSLRSNGGGRSSLPAPPPGCVGPRGRCTYSIEYADTGSSQGYLVSDAVSLRFTSNGTLAVPGLVLGCGYNQQGGTAATPMDGVLGLGQGKSGILAQLRQRGAIRNVVGHCLGSKGGGFLFLGDALVPPSGMTWVPLSTRADRVRYSPGPGVLFLGNQAVVPRGFQLVFDSGSSYTYLSSSTYGAFLTALIKDLIGKPLKQAPEDRTLPLCWKGAKPFRSLADAKGFFSSVVLGFQGGAGSKLAGMNIPPEGYLIVSNSGNVCLGILNGTQAGLGDINVLGDISMQDQLIVYDNERAQIGWARTNCDRSVKPTRLNL